MYLPLCQAAGIVNESITIHPTPVPPLIIPHFTAFVKPVVAGKQQPNSA